MIQKELSNYQQKSLNNNTGSEKDKIKNYQKLCLIINQFYDKNVQNIKSLNKNYTNKKQNLKNSENHDIIIKIEKIFKKFMKTNLEINKSKSDHTLRINKQSLSPLSFDKEFKKANPIIPFSKSKHSGRIIKPSNFFQANNGYIKSEANSSLNLKKNGCKKKLNFILGNSNFGSRNLENKHSNSYYK